MDHSVAITSLLAKRPRALLTRKAEAVRAFKVVARFNDRVLASQNDARFPVRRSNRDRWHRPPRAGEERDSARRTMGVGLRISSPVTSMSIEKKYSCRTYTPDLRSMRVNRAALRQLIMA